MFRTNLNYLYSAGKLVLKYNRYEITICQRFNNMSKQFDSSTTNSPVRRNIGFYNARNVMLQDSR